MNDFVLCINNEKNSASLVIGKVYRRLTDPDVESQNYFRVLDDDLSEPDGYIYPASLFVAIELPEDKDG